MTWLQTGALKLSLLTANAWIFISNYFKYQTAVVRKYWIVDLERQLVTVYNFKEEMMETYSLHDKLRVGIYADLYIYFTKRIFLKATSFKKPFPHLTLPIILLLPRLRSLHLNSHIPTPFHPYILHPHDPGDW